MTSGTGKARKLIRAVPLIFLDVVATAIAYVAAAWGTGVMGEILGLGDFAQIVICIAVVNVAVFAVGHLYSILWEYASVDELVRIVLVVTVASAVADALTALAFGQRLPFRVYGVAWIILLCVCGASRFAIRLYSGQRGWKLLGVTQAATAGKPRTLIVGAGETGSLTVKRMLAGDPDMQGMPVGLVDDDQAKQGQLIHGVRVLGTIDDIPAICAYSNGGRGAEGEDKAGKNAEATNLANADVASPANADAARAANLASAANAAKIAKVAKNLHVDQIVIAVPSSTKQERDRIYAKCMETGVRTQTLPLIHDLPQGLDGKLTLHDVEISDLLAREEVALDLGRMGYVTGKTVLVTGGGGSIGSELVRQLLPAKPARIVLFDIYENTTYELYHEIAGPAAEQGVDVRTYIGSITHLPAIEACFDQYEPDVVFHAAAHKHVPLMEKNAREAIENNVFGTLNVVRLAHERGCTHYVQISTDKAVNPANVMGATKRMDEMIVQHYASISDTVFTCVRFGNVLGSHGSVIPLFRRQLKEGGPITLTHRDITRYFMTIPEASRLVITAGALAKGGEIFVLDMGEPVRIYDLAVNLITLSGLKPGRDIEIREVGLRPGEKMYEELLMADEELIPTDHKDIRVSRAKADQIENTDVEGKLKKLEACLEEDNESIKKVLAEVVPTYHPQHS